MLRDAQVRRHTRKSSAHAARTALTALVLLVFALLHRKSRSSVCVAKILQRLGDSGSFGKHVLFTASSCAERPCSRLRQQIEWNTRVNLGGLSERYEFIHIPVENHMRNSFGLPKLTSLYLAAFSLRPRARTYTYINADIILSHDFVETIDFISEVVSDEFLAVGTRTNVEWRLSMNVSSDFNFQDTFKRGTRMSPDAQDYFVCTRNAIKWNKIPEFVIGRPGYDNWLVDHVYHDSNVILIDASNTIKAIHQTAEDGNHATQFAHQIGQIKKADFSYNRELGKGQWDHGKIFNAQWRTALKGHEMILIKHCETTQMS